MGPRYHCRAWGAEYDQETRDGVRDCPRWTPFRPLDASGRHQRLEGNPIFAPIVEAEDHLFWQLKAHLDAVGVDLKTVLVLAQPSITSAAPLDWIDSLEDRFSDDSELEQRVEPLPDVLAELRALRYDGVCDILRHLLPQGEGAVDSPVEAQASPVA
jgi:hypothetical protein